MFNFTKEEERILKSLNSPAKIQDYLNDIPINFEEEGDRCMSPRMVLQTGKCHCIEGAMFAAVALRLQGKKPLIVDLTATKDDFDHVIAVFKENGMWGAISKTNHGVLRYREPVYKSIRELVMSFFHEYTDDKGRKTLREYSMPVNLSRFDKKGWMTAEEDVWYVDKYLKEVKHYKILNRKQIKRLRKADELEIEIGKVTEWRKEE